MWLARKPPGFGFVWFQHGADATAACERYNGRSLLGRRVVVQPSVTPNPLQARDENANAWYDSLADQERKSDAAAERGRDRHRDRDRRRGKGRDKDVDRDGEREREPDTDAKIDKERTANSESVNASVDAQEAAADADVGASSKNNDDLIQLLSLFTAEQTKRIEAEKQLRELQARLAQLEGTQQPTPELDDSKIDREPGAPSISFASASISTSTSTSLFASELHAVPAAFPSRVGAAAQTQLRPSASAPVSVSAADSDFKLLAKLDAQEATIAALQQQLQAARHELKQEQKRHSEVEFALEQQLASLHDDHEQAVRRARMEVFLPCMLSLVLFVICLCFNLVWCAADDLDAMTAQTFRCLSLINAERMRRTEAAFQKRLAEELRIKRQCLVCFASVADCRFVGFNFSYLCSHCCAW